MIGKIIFAALSIALAHGKPEPPLLVSAPKVAYASAPVVLAKAVSPPVAARIAVEPVPVATSTSSQYVSRTYNGVATYAVAAPIAPTVVETRARLIAPTVVDARGRYVTTVPSQVVLASSTSPAQIVVSQPQFLAAAPVSTSSQFITRSFNGLPTVTYYTIPAVSAAPVAAGVPTVAAPVPSVPVAPPTQSSTEVEVLDA